MTEHTTELPIFPVTAPAIFCDPDATGELFDEVLNRLAPLVDIDAADLGRPTPCAGFDVAQLRMHVLGWLDFFAAALSDPAASTHRPDPDAFTIGESLPSDHVRRSADTIRRAIADDAAGQLVTMSSSRMAGDGVLAMALGEYLIHAWDLATATGQTYEAPSAAVGPAHEFLLGMVAPEYRGPDTGFFDAEVEVGDDASGFEKLLGFAGRDPR